MGRSRATRRLRVSVAPLVAAALVGAALLVNACGESDSPEPSQASPVGIESAGSVAQLADCADWNGGTEAERRATVVELRGQLTSQTDAAADSLLPDDRAYEVFMHSCEEDFAAGLRLYKLYVRAAAFEPLRP